MFHTDIYGTREYKYSILSESSLGELPFENVTPVLPDCVFKKVNETLRSSYYEGFSINELFISGANGIITARDALNLSISKSELYDRLTRFYTLTAEEARDAFGLGRDATDWKVELAQRDIEENATVADGIDESKIIKIMYRVFDERWMLYTGQSRGLISRPRTEITNQFVHMPNIGLATGRTNKTQSCDHFLAVNKMIEKKTAERSTCACVFPVYTYYYMYGEYKKQSNYSEKIIERFCKKTSLRYVFGSTDRNNEKEFNELDMFYYMYSVLYCRSYRKKYFEFLKSDFPRIPFPESVDKFWQLVVVGEKLVDLHLMSNKINLPGEIRFADKGRDVKKVCLKEGRVYINKESYFEGVDKQDWDFLIGGYAPIQYWFRDRKNKALSEDEITHYRKIIYVVRETQVLMDEIEKIIHFG